MRARSLSPSQKRPKANQTNTMVFFFLIIELVATRTLLALYEPCCALCAHLSDFLLPFSIVYIYTHDAHVMLRFFVLHVITTTRNDDD